MRKFHLADFFCWAMVLVWGVNMSLMKGALNEISPMSFNAVRLVLAALLLWVLTVAIEQRFQIVQSDLKKVALLGLIGNTVYQLFFIHGLDRTKAGNVGLLLSAGTIFTALLSRALGHERLGRIVWAGIFVSVLGVLLILLESAEFALSGGAVVGDLLILGSAACWSVYTVYARPLMKTYSPLSLTTLTLSFGSCGFLIFAAPQLVSESWAEVSVLSYVTLIYSFTFSLAVGYAMWFYAIHRLGSTRTAIYGNLIPFSALLFAWLFLAEKITLVQILGGALIVTGIFLTRRGRGPDAPAAIRQRQY